MGRQSNYPPEVRERAIRMVAEVAPNDGSVAVGRDRGSAAMPRSEIPAVGPEVKKRFPGCAPRNR
jgi:hypothetical protein